MFISALILQYLKLHIADMYYSSVLRQMLGKSEANDPFLTFHWPPRRRVYCSLRRSDSQTACMMLSLYISITLLTEPACWVKPLDSCPPQRAPQPPVWCTASTSLTHRNKGGKKINKSKVHFNPPSIYQEKAYRVKRPLRPPTSSSCRRQVPAGGRFSVGSGVVDKNTSSHL